MYHSVRKLVQTELATRCPQIAFAVEISFLVAVYTCGDSVNPDIKLSLVNQQRVVNVALNDTRLSGIGGVGFYDALDFGPVFRNLNTDAAICILAWFQDPNVSFFCFRCLLVELLETQEFGIFKSIFNVECHG
jgi:hypothetical protein